MFRAQNLYQNDKKWRNTKLGNSSETIGEWGGLLTSVAIMLNGIGYNETPETVNEKMIKASGFLRALPIPSLLSYVWPNCIYLGMERCEKSSAPIEKIDAAVAAGKPVILEVDSESKRGVQTHFVLIKEKRGDDYVLFDPDKVDGDGPDKDVLLTTRYNHNGGKLKSEISAVLWFDFYSAALPEHRKGARIPVPLDKYPLYVAEDDLVLRAEPSADSYPWKRMVAGTELTCLESKATVKVKLGVEGHWIRVQDPHGDQGYVAAKYVTSMLILSPRRKWCLKNIVVQDPQFETWSLDGTIHQEHKPVKSFGRLLRNTVVSVLESNERIPGSSKIMYQKTYYDPARKKWVTTRLTGWVKDADLDDYRERENDEFQRLVVDIRDQTENSTDAQQYLYIKDEDGRLKARYNMCGELCVASIIEKDSETVLREWRDHSKESKGLYDSMVGKADEPLERRHIENLLNIHIGEDNYERYKMDKQGNSLEKYIILAASNEEQPRADQRLASKALQDQLKTHYFITNLKIDTNTGDLEEAHSAGERNHWVVLDRITRNGSRVELYNPFPNKREEYTFGEFYKSVGGDPNSGWWIKREVNPTFAGQKLAMANQGLPASKFESAIDERTESIAPMAAAGRKGKHSPERADEDFQHPKFEVAIDNRTEDTKDAEQYVYIPGGGSKKRNNLCGEFSVAFILGQSMDAALAHWQEGLKKDGKQPGIWELATLLQAYGFNRRKYLAENGLRTFYAPPKVEPDTPAKPEKYIKSFSIDTVLEYWKGVQPDLYNSILGENRDEPTGPEDLITILKAYGYGRYKVKGEDKTKADVYDREDYSYYRPGSQEFFGVSPARDAEALKTHFVIAGVHINKITGRLRPTGVAHWVVVTKITPEGNLVGGNGGWVELYNPFPNCWEEYSYREFMASFSGSSEGATLWVKRDISPVFEPQSASPAKSQEKASEKKAIGKGNKNSKSNPKAEKDRQRDEEKGKRKKDAGLENDYDKPVIDIPKLVRERLEVASIPREIGRWIRNKSKGDPFFAETLAEAIRESGLLAIHEEVVGNKKRRTAVLADLASSDALKTAKTIMTSLGSSPGDSVFRIASAALPLFTASAIDEIQTVQKTMPVQAYIGRPEFMAWTHGLAFGLSGDPEAEIIEIKNRFESLSVFQKNQSEAFEDGSMIVPGFASREIEEIRKFYYGVQLKKQIEKIHSDPQIWEAIGKIRDLKPQGEIKKEISWPEFEEWTRGFVSTPRSNVYRVRRWGDPVMKKFDFDINIERGPAKDFSSNFQAVGLYNKAEGFGAISNFLIIPPDDVAWLESLQIEDEYEAKVPDWLHQKMSWLCQERGSIYMFSGKEKGRSPWRRSDGIRWGTLALAGNLVQVERFEDFDPPLTTPSGIKVTRMAKLVGLKRKDMSRPLDQLLALGLVHRCFCVEKGVNGFGDSPKGIVYSPFWSLGDEWEFRPQQQKNKPVPEALYIPAEYLEPRPTLAEKPA